MNKSQLMAILEMSIGFVNYRVHVYNKIQDFFYGAKCPDHHNSI